MVLRFFIFSPNNVLTAASEELHDIEWYFNPPPERQFTDGFSNLRCKMVGWNFEFLNLKFILVFQLATSKLYL